MAVTAAQVKELRALTSAPMSDCKKALKAEGVDGDMQKAMDWLRKNGVATASKKAGRAAAEGAVCIKAVPGDHDVPTSAVMVEVNSETDFVARNADFVSFVERVTEAAVATASATASDADNLAALKAAALPGGDSAGNACTVEEGVTDMIAKFRENLVLRRVAIADVADAGAGIVGTYMHNSMGPGIGRIGSVVALSADSALDADATEQIHALSRTIAMHVVAATPIAVTRDQVDDTVLQREMDILSEQARMSGKPEDIVQRMVQGRLKKFYEQNMLTEQACVIGDDDRPVGAIVEDMGKRLGTQLSVASFYRFHCGEGAEAPEQDEQ